MKFNENSKKGEKTERPCLLILFTVSIPICTKPKTDMVLRFYKHHLIQQFKKYKIYFRMSNFQFSFKIIMRNSDVTFSQVMFYIVFIKMASWKRFLAPIKTILFKIPKLPKKRARAVYTLMEKSDSNTELKHMLSRSLFESNQHKC